VLNNRACEVYKWIETCRVNSVALLRLNGTKLAGDYGGFEHSARNSLNSVPPGRILAMSYKTQTPFVFRVSLVSIRLQERMPIMPRILVVDDEKVIADMLVTILNLSGYEASAVYSGEDAVETAIRMRPDIVLTDVVMGLMSGVVAGVMIRRLLPECRVILFSGQASIVPLLKGAEEKGHVFELLPKPMDPARLLAYLKEGGKAS
jgi:CheY-like chemotaxis protein